ncbi:MAG: ATP-binding protein [Candidatus Thorarchaeota archaeon]
MVLPKDTIRLFGFLRRYPNIGKVASSVFGALEVPFLEAIRFLDHHTRLSYFSDLMKHFTRLYRSRVIPLNISLEAVQAVSPTEEILNVVRRVSALAIGYCYCRSTHKNCDSEVWTCIHVGTAESLSELAERMPIKSATLEEVEELIIRSNERGLVHQLLTAPSPDYFYVICNCCPCCCVMLRSAVNYGMTQAVLASNFLAEQIEDKCNNCGQCISRCHFNARYMDSSTLVFVTEKCVGCGLCVSSCELGAIKMSRRTSFGCTRPLHPLK